jgi:membrane-associated phospholipid phosphatase
MFLLVNTFVMGQVNRDSTHGQHPTPSEGSAGSASPLSSDKTWGDDRAFLRPGADPENHLVLPFAKHLVQDQKQFWTYPLHFRMSDAKYFVPFAVVTASFIASDSWISKQVPASPTQLKRSRDFSNYALIGLVGGAGTTYLWGHLKGDDHASEAGLLAGEAAINSTAITYAFRGITQRTRPLDRNGTAAFFQGGASFPSEHAAIAWSAASVLAHEYPGTLPKMLAYALATGVTISRVTAKQHFASDAVVGSALGWYMGRQVYRAHHDPEVGGTAWGGIKDDAEKGPRNPKKMGSPFVPLDSWVYPAIEKLAALGFVNTAFTGLKPWTRLECADLVEQMEDSLEGGESVSSDVNNIYTRLHQEFSYEFGLLAGDRNANVALESIYVRGVSASGPVLTDSYHFGQTFAYDFGRPFRRGTNFQTGASIHASAGPITFFVRGEYQHAPSAPALSSTVRDFIAAADWVAAPSGNAFSQIDRGRLLDAYASLKLGSGWQVSVGQQSLSWSVGPGGSLLWIDNAEPIPMVRILQTAERLPGFLKFFGPARIDNFFGRLEGHTFIPGSYVYGNKINLKPFSNLEFGIGRTVIIGGRGGDPLTFQNFFRSVFGRVDRAANSVPGDSHSDFDWTFRVPKIHDYLVFYGEVYADDDFLPWQNPSHSPFRPGIYIPKFPGLSKLDLHVEATSTESPGFVPPPPLRPGQLNYWNDQYRDGYTNNGNLIGNTVGRMGRTIQAWSRYWITANSTLQFSYKHNTVAKEFVPQGGAWQDYSVNHEINLPSGLYAKSQVQYENISSFPLLFSGPKHNVTVVVEVGLIPHKKD